MVRVFKKAHAVANGKHDSRTNRQVWTGFSGLGL